MQIAHGPGGRAREGDRAPGPEAREPVPHEGRAGQDPGLRPGEADADGSRRGGRRRTCRPRLAATEPGVVMGTLGYMSPEQVKGKAADARSRHLRLRRDPLRDALGPARVPPADSAADTMSAILHEGAAGPVARRTRSVQPGPRARRAALPGEEPRGALPLGARPRLRPRGAVGHVRAAARPSRRRRAGCGSARVPLLVGLARRRRRDGGGLLARKARRLRAAREVPPAHASAAARSRRLASRRTARRSSTRPPGTATRSRCSSRASIARSRARSASPNAEVLSISPSGEMAVSLNRRGLDPVHAHGHARAPGHDRRAARRRRSSRTCCGPSGRPTARASPSSASRAARCGWSIPSGRCSTRPPAGSRTRESRRRAMRSRSSITPRRATTPARPASSTVPERRRTVSEIFPSAQGLAWSPDGSEVWFTAASEGFNRALRAATRSGRGRILAQATGGLTVQDVSKTGRVLAFQEKARQGISVLLPGSEKERDFSWLDWGLIRDVTPDGQMILFDETGEGGGPGYSVYVRKADGSPAVRLGRGVGAELSPDGRLALAAREAGRSLSARDLPDRGGRAEDAAGDPDPRRAGGLAARRPPDHPFRKRAGSGLADLGTGSRRSEAEACFARGLSDVLEMPHARRPPRGLGRSGSTLLSVPGRWRRAHSDSGTREGRRPRAVDAGRPLAVRAQTRRHSSANHETRRDDRTKGASGRSSCPRIRPASGTSRRSRSLPTRSTTPTGSPAVSRTSTSWTD